MGLLSGSVSISRFNVTKVPTKPDFEKAGFREIEPGSEVRLSRGFVPIEPGEPYKFGHKRWAFRVRIDRLRPDPTTVRERYRALIRTELDAGAEYVGPKKRKELRTLAEEEVLVRTSPTSRIIEGVIDGKELYVASTARNQIGIVLEVLREINISAEPKAPWTDREQPEVESEVSIQEPGQSILGARFLRDMWGDAELTIEPEAGYVRLCTADTKVTLAGVVEHDLMHFIEHEAEIVNAKMTTGEITFRFDALSFSVSNLRVDTERYDHWTNLLDARLEKISEVFDLLEAKFEEVVSALG